MTRRRAPFQAAVIGGGITGLTAAYHLKAIAAAREVPITVTLFEGSSRPGGALETIRRGGLLMETGADSFLSEKPAARRLAERLQIVGDLVNTRDQFRRTMVVRSGRLIPIPDGFSLMAPTWMGPVWRSPLFSIRGKLRIALEPWIPARRNSADYGDGDESLASFVSRRLGREVLDRLAQPLAAGIYTADPATLSVNATLQRFPAMERQHGSVIRGLRAAAKTRNAQARGTSGARWSLFLSFSNGMSTLVDALAKSLGESLQSGGAVTELTLVSGESRWLVRRGDRPSFAADAVICATPSYAAAHILEGAAPALAAQLRQISYASAATVNLAWRATAFPAVPSSFGFVVPIIERRKIIAGSFSSLKFDGRAPAGTIVTRVFMGGALQTGMMALDDAQMAAAARDEFRDLFGVTAEPLYTCVRRWPESMPQYLVGHHARISAIEAEAAKYDRLLLTGAWLAGVGIPDCIAAGERAAESALAMLIDTWAAE
jgi:protoporphyrinogen/coproporphyrinogen III oxidase